MLATNYKQAKEDRVCNRKDVLAPNSQAASKKVKTSCLKQHKDEKGRFQISEIAFVQTPEPHC